MNPWDVLDYDAEWGQVRRWAMIGLAIWLTVAAAVLSAVGYVAYLLLRHFVVI